MAGCQSAPSSLTLYALVSMSAVKMWHVQTSNVGSNTLFGISPSIIPTGRAVKKFWSSWLIVNSRQLWISHQRYKFLRAKGSRDILKFRVLEMAFPGVFKRHSPPRMPCYFVRIHLRLGCLFSVAYFLLAVIEEEDESSQLRVPN